MRPVAPASVPSLRRPVRVEVLGSGSAVLRSVLDEFAAEMELVDGSALAPPDIVLVPVPHPDAPGLESLPAIVSGRPGARLLLVTGAWCGSALRTRRFDFGGLWVDEESLASRLSLELAALRGEPVGGPLPATADRTEVFASESSPLVQLPSCRVGLDSSDPAFRGFCRDELTSCGATVVPWDGTPEVSLDTLVIDVDPLEGRHPLLQEPTPPCPLLILTSTPWRLDDLVVSQRYRVVSKLAGGGEWARALAALLSPSS